MANIVADIVDDITDKLALPNVGRVLPWPAEVLGKFGLPTPKTIIEDVVNRVKGFNLAPPWR
jgi:hypothetical protein